MQKLSDSELRSLIPLVDHDCRREKFLRALRIGTVEFVKYQDELPGWAPLVSSPWDGIALTEVRDRVFGHGISRRTIARILNLRWNFMIKPLANGWPTFSQSLLEVRSVSRTGRSFWMEDEIIEMVGGTGIHLGATEVCTSAYFMMGKTACALERFYAAEGHYPEALEELVPQFLVALEKDPVSGDPIRYRMDEENGRYILWCVGFDVEDDGGKIIPEPMATGKFPSLASFEYEGDWVWRYPVDSGK